MKKPMACAILGLFDTMLSRAYAMSVPNVSFGHGSIDTAFCSATLLPGLHSPRTVLGANEYLLILSAASLATLPLLILNMRFGAAQGGLSALAARFTPWL